jgi:hypothetical protein
MTTIHLFQPRKLDISIDFPTIWDELHLSEMKIIAQAIDRNCSKNELLCKLVQYRAGNKLPANWVARLDHELAAIEGLPLIDLLLQNNNLTLNPLPHIRSRFRNYYGPSDEFNDLTTGEFEDCESLFIKYSRHQDPSFLADMVTVLYRRKKHGKRAPYTGFSGEPSFSGRLHPTTLQLVYFWYAGCRSSLPLAFPRVFSGGAALDNGEPDLMAVTTLIHNGAGPKNGTRDQVRRTMIKEFLFDCELMIEQQEELEAELEKIRSQNKH